MEMETTIFLAITIFINMNVKNTLNIWNILKYATETKFKWVVAIKIKVQQSVCDAHSVQESPYKADLRFWMMFPDFPRNLKL